MARNGNEFHWRTLCSAAGAGNWEPEVFQVGQRVRGLKMWVLEVGWGGVAEQVFNLYALHGTKRPWCWYLLNLGRSIDIHHP